VYYYLRAADSSGRKKNHPFIGEPDPHMFTTGYASEVTIDPDTLVFLTVEEMNDGKTFNICNFTNGSLLVNDIETGSSGNIDWHIEPWDYTLPFTMPFRDTVSLTVRIDGVDNQLSDLLTDTLDMVIANENHQLIIKVSVPGRWKGSTSSDWNTPSNWSNHCVPAASTDIFIPANSINWPVYSGNLTLGETCGNITLEGSSQLTVTGSLTINPGKNLILRNNAVLYQAPGGTER
jgi:hypothetical protein